jgi:hypothetical protein
MRSYGPQGELLVRFETATAVRRALQGGAEGGGAPGSSAVLPGEAGAADLAAGRGFSGAWLLDLVQAAARRAAAAGW